MDHLLVKSQVDDLLDHWTLRLKSQNSALGFTNIFFFLVDDLLDKRCFTNSNSTVHVITRPIDLFRDPDTCDLDQ